jgi:hypothetical protein
VLVIIISFFSIFFLVSYIKLNTHGYLSFSDGAKFADVARNIIAGNGHKTNFSFFGNKAFSTPSQELFPAGAIPQLMPRLLAFTFGLLGITDFSVVLTSSVHFILLVITTYFLGTKLYGKLAGFLAGLSVAANVNFLNYATSGASEPLFTFLGVLGVYLVIIKSRWANIAAVTVMVLLYFTRPQAVMFVAALFLLFMTVNFGYKKAVIVSTLSIGGIYILDKLILYPMSFKYPVYPIMIRAKQALFTYSSSSATSDALRGVDIQRLTTFQMLSKVFYNTYNFYRLLPRIISPYLFAFFVLGLFKYSKDKNLNAFKLFTVLAFFGTLIIYVLTIPLFRYIHPIIPFVYLISVGTLISIIRNSQFAIRNKFSIFNIQLSKKIFLILTSLFLILLFAIGQSLGMIFLDSRFEAENLNKGKPPVYVVLSRLLKDNTSDNDVVVTNLDTWGSWYGERKTVWYPGEPEQLKNPKTEDISFDAIYLTSYLIDDENYYMGESWRKVFSNPENHNVEIIKNNFIYEKAFIIEANETYENKSATAILLLKK